MGVTATISSKIDTYRLWKSDRLHISGLLLKKNLVFPAKAD